MKNKRFLTLAFFFTVLSLPLTIFGQCPQGKELVLDALVNTGGEKFRGPACVKIIHLNRLRYQIEIGTQTTIGTGPSLELPFLPQLAKSAVTGARFGGGTVQERVAKLHSDLRAPNLVNKSEDQFLIILGALSEFEVLYVVDLASNPISDLLGKTKLATDEVDRVVRVSDDLLATGERVLLAQLPAVITAIKSSQANEWPDKDINELLGALDGLKTALRSISDPAWLGQAQNKARYDSANASIDQLRARLILLSHNGDANSVASKFDETRKKLNIWLGIFEAAVKAQSDFFSHTLQIGCDAVFGGSKETKIKVAKKDRLAPENTQAVERELATIECSSPISISGGFGFSNLEEKEIVFVQATKQTIGTDGKPVQTLVNKFGFKGQSSFRTIPVLLLNTRFWEPNDTVSFHFSTGAAVDIKAQVGTDVEFIVGPSVSFKRSLFITPGLYIGRTAKLAGGFQIGDEVPTGVSSPPLEKSWKPSFAFTFTYKIR